MFDIATRGELLAEFMAEARGLARHRIDETLAARAAACRPLAGGCRHDASRVTTT